MLQTDSTGLQRPGAVLGVGGVAGGGQCWPTRCTCHLLLWGTLYCYIPSPYNGARAEHWIQESSIPETILPVSSKAWHGALPQGIGPMEVPHHWGKGGTQHPSPRGESGMSPGEGAHDAALPMCLCWQHWLNEDTGLIWSFLSGMGQLHSQHPPAG